MSERKPFRGSHADIQEAATEVDRLAEAVAKTILEQEPTDPELATLIAQYKINHRGASVTHVETATDVVFRIGKLSFPDSRLDELLRKLSEGVAGLLLADPVGRQKLVELWGE